MSKATTTKETIVSPTIAPVPEPTSAKLVELQSLKIAAQKLLTKTEVGTEDFDKSVLAITQIGDEIKKELANIKRLEAELKLADERNARVAKRVQFEEALRAEMDYFYGEYKKTKNMEAMNLLTDATKKASIVLDEELLNKSRSIKTNGVTKTSSGVSKGDTGEKIIELFLANREAGMDDTENKKAVINAGFSRGTTGAVVLAWQRENGEKE